MSERLYILYDSRACADQGTEDASVLEACEDDADAKSACGLYGAMACYSYAHGPGSTLIDERWEWDYWPQAGIRRRRKRKAKP
jgi:hypothetical protein